MTIVHFRFDSDITNKLVILYGLTNKLGTQYSTNYRGNRGNQTMKYKIYS